MSYGKYEVRSDHILFVDFELTCWDGLPPPGERPEIIEVGIVNFNVRKQVADKSDSFLVRNTLSSISEKCTSLTGITQEKLNKHGRPLFEVCQTIKKKYGTQNKAWAAWGKDEEAILRDCAEKKVEMPFSAVFYDVGRLHTLMDGAGKAIGLKAAVQSFGLEPFGTHHSAKDDAIELARYFMALTSAMRGLRLGQEVEQSSRMTAKI